MNMLLLRYLIGLLKDMLQGRKVVISWKECLPIKISIDPINQLAYTPNQLSSNDTNCQGTHAIACHSIPFGTMRMNKINHLGDEKPDENELPRQEDNKIMRIKRNGMVDQCY